MEESPKLAYEVKGKVIAQALYHKIHIIYTDRLKSRGSLALRQAENWPVAKRFDPGHPGETAQDNLSRNCFEDALSPLFTERCSHYFMNQHLQNTFKECICYALSTDLHPRPICALDRSLCAINGSVVTATLDRSCCASRWIGRQDYDQRKPPERLRIVNCSRQPECKQAYYRRSTPPLSQLKV